MFFVLFLEPTDGSNCQQIKSYDHQHHAEKNDAYPTKQTLDHFLFLQYTEDGLADNIYFNICYNSLSAVHTYSSTIGTTDMNLKETRTKLIQFVTSLHCPQNYPCSLPKITPGLERKKKHNTKHPKELNPPRGCSVPPTAKSFLVFMAPTACKK